MLPLKLSGTVSEMERNAVNKRGHTVSPDDGCLPTHSDDKDTSQITTPPNILEHVPSSHIAGIRNNERKVVQEEGQTVRERYIKQDEKEHAQFCDTNDNRRLDRVVYKGATLSNSECQKEETEEVERTYSSDGISLLHTSRKAIGREGTRDVSDVPDKKVNPDNNGASAPSTMNKATSYYTHTLSFPIVNKNQEKDSQWDTESESQLSVSQMSGSEACASSDLSGVKVRSKTKKQKSHIGSKDGRNSDSSVSSRKKKGSSNKTHIKSKFSPGSLEYIEQQLCGRIFSGWVEERRWVDTVHAYRDVIEVDEWEVEMNQHLNAIITSIPGVHEGTKWINLTPPGESPCYCLWVLLPAPPIPGHYWYTITGVHLEPQFGLRLLVKEIRRIHEHDGETDIARRRRHQMKSLTDSGTSFQTLREQFQEWVNQACQLSFSAVWCTLSSTVTLGNIKEVFRFVAVLVMTLVIGLFSFWRDTHNLGLRYIREVGIFLRNITPFLQSLLAFIEKLIGGMYLLIAMVYRDWRRPSAPPPSYPQRGQSPLYLPQGQGAVLGAGGSRVVKYVPPQQWVFKSQSNESSPS